jgi:hypothetical protein
MCQTVATITASSNRVSMREALLIQHYILKYRYITTHQCILGLKCSNSLHLYLSGMKSKNSLMTIPGSPGK